MKKEELIETLDTIYEGFVGLPDHFDRDKQRVFIEIMDALNISEPTFLRYTQRIAVTDMDVYRPWYKI